MFRWRWIRFGEYPLVKVRLVCTGLSQVSEIETKTVKRPRGTVPIRIVT